MVDSEVERRSSGSEHDMDLPPRWMQQGWMELSACRGRTELFFPPAGERPQQRAEREAEAHCICAECVVRPECRSYARFHREHGFWGGESEEERLLAGYPPLHPIVPRSVRRRMGSKAPAA